MGRKKVRKKGMTGQKENKEERNWVLNYVTI
jgi:hypothetical protein